MSLSLGITLHHTFEYVESSLKSGHARTILFLDSSDPVKSAFQCRRAHVDAPGFDPLGVLHVGKDSVKPRELKVVESDAVGHL